MTNSIQSWRTNKELHKLLGKRGEIIVWTHIYVPPAGYEHEVPYVVALIEFSDGKRRTLQVVDCEEEQLQVGLAVTTVIRRIGKVGREDVISYGIKAKPLL